MCKKYYFGVVALARWILIENIIKKNRIWPIINQKEIQNRVKQIIVIKPTKINTKEYVWTLIEKVISTTKK